MSKPRTIVSPRSLSVSVALVTVAMLSGCFAGPAEQQIAENPAEPVVEDAVAEDAPSTGYEGESLELPADFPAEIPVFDGPISSVSAFKTGPEKLGYWSLHVRADDSGAAISGERERLVAAGFEEQKWIEVGALLSGVFITPKYRVAFQTAKDINGEMILYTVTEESAD